MYYHLRHSKNLEIERKVNLFFDYFRFVAEHIGLIDDLPLENHLSLVEKIIFQIEHNPNHRVKYISSYLTNPLLGDPFIKKFSAFADLELLIKRYNCSDDKKNFIRDTPEFESSLKSLKEELSERAFKCSLDAVVDKVCSPHSVGNFINKISCHVRLLVSEFLFTHRSRGNIINVINSITDPDRFPYPADIATKEKKDKIKYFKELSLKDRLLVINEIYRREQRTHTFVCKVYDLDSHPEFEFKYREVTFRSKEKSDAVIKYKDDWNKEMSERFLDDQKAFIVAYLPVSYHSFSHNSVAKSTAIATIREELSNVNDILGTNGVVDVRDYLLLDASGRLQSLGSSTAKKIDANSVSKLKNSSAYVHLSERNNAAKKHILNHEPYLSAALLSRRPADYWHYLETIITNAFPNKKKKVEDFLPDILLINHLSQQKNLADSYIRSAFRRVYYEQLGLTHEQWNTLRQKELLSIDELLAEVDDAFTNEITVRYLKKDHANYSKLKEYYRSILTEAYEQRNAYQHAGYECEKATIKLNHTLPRLLIRFRWLILERANVPGDIRFAKILIRLKNEGKQLCSS